MSSTSCQRFGVRGSRGRSCARARRPAPPRGAGPAPRRRPARRTRGRRGGSSARGSTSSPSSSSAVRRRPWVSTSPTTTSVPRSNRRRASPSMANVLPTPGRRAEVDAQLTALGHPPSLRPRQGPAGFSLGRAPTSWLSTVTFTLGSPRNPSVRPLGGLRDQLPHPRHRQPGDPGHPGDLQRRVGRADVRVQPGGRGGHRVGGHRGRGDAFPGGDQGPPLVHRVQQLGVEAAPVGAARGAVSAGPSTSAADAAGRVWKYGSAAGSAGTGSTPISGEPTGVPSALRIDRALGPVGQERAAAPPPRPASG